MTRHNRPPQAQPQSGFAALASATEQDLAADVERIIQATKEFEPGTIKGLLFKKSPNGMGPWASCDECYPDQGQTFDLFAIMRDMRERFGPGNYELRVFAGGRQRAVWPFTVAQDKAPAPAPAAPAQPQGLGAADLVAMMLSQAAEARRDQAAAADRQMALMAEMGKSQAAMMTAILGRPQNSMADTLALVAALQGAGGKSPGLKDMVETLVALDGLRGGSGGDAGGDRGGGDGLDLESLVHDGGRLVGPLVKGLADLVTRRRGDPDDPSAGGAAGRGPVDQLALGAPGSPPPSRTGYRVLDLIGDDVLYFYGRGHDPEKAADLVFDVIEANHVTEPELQELATTFALSPTGLDDLAALGIDLRERAGWAVDFFRALYAIHQGEGDDSAGGGGGEGDAAGNGAAREPGEARSAH